MAVPRKGQRVFLGGTLPDLELYIVTSRGFSFLFFPYSLILCCTYVAA